MSPLLGRVTTQLKVWLNTILSPADDPREAFIYTYERQRELLAQIQQAVDDIAASKSRLERMTIKVKDKLPHLEEQARQALAGFREDLARLALQRRQVAVVELQNLETQVREVEQEEQRLSLAEQRLAAQIEAFYTRQELIAARYSAAEAQVRINEALGGVSQELADLGKALVQAEQKTDRMQARAAAIDGLVEAGILEMPDSTGEDYVDRLLARSDVSQIVESQLVALKQEIR